MLMFRSGSLLEDFPQMSGYSSSGVVSEVLTKDLSYDKFDVW